MFPYPPSPGGHRSAAALLALLFAGLAGPAPGDGPDNPAIDMRGYLRAAGQAAQHRETRRLTEEEFRRKSREPGTIVLDARSADKFADLHVRGALSLPFTDMTVETLARLLPDRATTVLIYCNNNFANAPEPFPTKLPTASLNLSTYIALWTYGYRNVYELGPLLDLESTRLDFDGTLVPAPLTRSDPAG